MTVTKQIVPIDERLSLRSDSRGRVTAKQTEPVDHVDILTYPAEPFYTIIDVPKYGLILEGAD